MEEAGFTCIELDGEGTIQAIKETLPDQLAEFPS